LTSRADLEDTAMAMSNSPESNSKLATTPPSRTPADRPADPPAPGPAKRPEMSLERKVAMLTDKRMVNAIKKIARKCKVPFDTHEDVLQETGELVVKARLPEVEEEARKITHRIAYTVCCRIMKVDPMGEPLSYSEEYDEEGGILATPASVQPAPMEVRDGLEQLAEKGRERFQGRFDHYVEARAKEETSTEAAARRGIREDAQRQESSRIQKFMRVHGRKMGLLTAAGLVVLVFSAIRMSKWTGYMQDYPMHDVNDRATIRKNAPVADDAPSLRQRARRSHEVGDWEACLHDLDAAKQLDPAGETPEMKEWRAEAERETFVREAGQVPKDFNGAKPGLRGPVRMQPQH
jgi:hypothetical protein